MAVPSAVAYWMVTPPTPAGELRPKPKFMTLVPLSPSNALTSLTDTSGRPTPPMDSEKSSIARPSSAPVPSASFQRRQNVAPLAMFRPLMVAASVVRLPTALPSLAPTVAVLGVTKSSALTSTQVPVVSEVASRLYWKSSWSARAAVPRRHCSPV